MKAAVIEAFGPAIPMQLRDVPRPAPGPGQVLVEVHAASVNPIDWKIPGGQMAMRYGSAFPMTLGFDASGVVVEVGADVTGFAPGDEVFARSDVGAGGVGTYAVQIARNMGAHVTAVCSAANGALARELGAEQVLDYSREPVLVPGANYDVIYDTIGAHNLAVARPALSATGVYLTLVPVPGIEFFIPGQTQRQPGGGYFLVWVPTAADLEILAGWVREGRLRSVIDSEFSLDDISAAHARSQTLRARGKIVLRVKD